MPVEQITKGLPDGAAIGRSDDTISFFGGTPVVKQVSTSLTSLGLTAASGGVGTLTTMTQMQTLLDKVDALGVAMANLNMATST